MTTTLVGAYSRLRVHPDVAKAAAPADSPQRRVDLVVQSDLAIAPSPRQILAADITALRQRRVVAGANGWVQRATGLLPGETYAEGIIRLLADAGEPVGAPDEEPTP